MLTSSKTVRSTFACATNGAKPRTGRRSASLNLLGRFERVVQHFPHPGERCGTKQPEGECEHKIFRQRRAVGAARTLRAINDRNIVRVHLSGDAKLAILLQEAVIK